MLKDAKTRAWRGFQRVFNGLEKAVRSKFDSFECAIHALAPKCGHCGCQIVGHGLEADGSFFCCAHCASEKGITELNDRV
jgi:hypothetical protein